MENSTKASDCVNFEVRGPLTECNIQNTLYYRAYTNGNASSITWVPSNGNVSVSPIITGNKSEVGILWNPVGLHYLICKETSLGCQDTLFLQPCCGSPASGIVDANDDNPSALAGQFLGTYSAITNTINVVGGTFKIQGELNFQQSKIQFIGTTFEMAPGSVIYVASQSRAAVFQNCTFHHSNDCPKMWQGIRTWQDSELHLIGCTIEDAQYAVVIKGKLYLNSINTTYDKNYVGIYVPPITLANSFGGGSLLEGNTFNGLPSLLPYYYGQAPIPHGSKSFVGMLFFNLHDPLPFSTAIGTQNHFTDLPYGIYAMNSDLNDLNNCSFERIQYSQPYISPTVGSAIYSNGNNKWFNIGDQNSGTDQKENYFTDCFFGIYGTGSLIPNIKYNHFMHGSSGLVNRPCIVLSDDKNQQVNISNNLFTESNFYTGGSGVNSFISTGIYISNAIPSNSTADISSNVFTNMRLGIYINNVNGPVFNPDAYQIHDNTIVSSFPFSIIAGPPHYTHCGIWLNAINHASIINNTISRSGSLTGAPNGFESMMFGFNLKFVQNSHIYMNNITTYGTAFRILGNCNNTRLFCNSMNSCVQGVRLANASMIQQGTAAIPSDNEWNLFPTPTNTTYNRIDGTSAGSINWYYRGLPNTPSYTNIYSPEPVNPQVIWPHANVNAAGTCPALNIDWASLLNHLLDIVNDAIVYPDYPDQYRYMDLEFAYRVLKADETIRALFPEFEQFHDQYKDLNIGAIDDAEEQINQGQLLDALIQLNLIVDSNTIEYNRRFTTTIAAHRLEDVNYEIDSADQEILHQIAWTDAWTGGEGVFNARHDLFIEVDDWANNLKIGNQAQQFHGQIKWSVSLFPNPAIDQMTVLNDFPHPENAIFKIFDLTGREIQKQNLSRNLVPTNLLSPGVYIGKLFYQNQFQSAVRFEIQH